MLQERREAEAAANAPGVKRNKLKQLWHDYGYVGVGTYLGIYVGTLGTLYVAISSGIVGGAGMNHATSSVDCSTSSGNELRQSQSVRAAPLALHYADVCALLRSSVAALFCCACVCADVMSLVDKLGMADHMPSDVSPKSSSFLLAWVATKLTEPARAALTLIVTPKVARMLGRAPPKATEAAVKEIVKAAVNSAKAK